MAGNSRSNIFTKDEWTSECNLQKKQEIDSRFMLVSVSQICITANKLSKSFTPTILFIFNSIFHDAVTISVSKTCLQYTQYKRIAHGCKPQKFGVPGEVHGMSED